MEQKSNVQYRAEKEYKNSREKFFLLLREIISNALHAVLIRETKEDNYVPKLNINIICDDTQCKIEVIDNGEGFNAINQKYFEELDRRNTEKEYLNFHPLGQGRLAIVYFADSAEYETVYKDNTGKYNKRTIPYPNTSEGLFSFSEYEEVEANNDTYTKLTILINKQQTFGRAKTFFKSYPTPELFKQWFIETFFPFLISNEALVITISMNGDVFNIKKDSIEAETQTEAFELILSDDNKYSFILWLIKNSKPMHGDNPITCFARNLRANLSNGHLNYSIDNNEGYTLYLTSNLFDESVDTKGEKIDVLSNDVACIQEKINEILDERFKTVIENNRKASRKNLKKFRQKYPSLEAFINESTIVEDKNIINEGEIIQSAINEKSRIEKRFWNQIDRDQAIDEEARFSDSEECHKLLNSSLHIYVKHREIILQRLHALIQKFDQNGIDKPELESSVHELFINRGITITDSSNINHLHNLWILDNKFTTFSNTFRVKSTKTGQALSDVYIWADDPNKTKQILIFELKSTTRAHNAGDKEEGMIAQVKRYAQKFYKHPEQTVNWRVNTEQVQYIGIILANKSDINKELSSINVSGTYYQIPFLEDSYYLDEHFSKDGNPKNKMPIRIELYSFEDIYELAYSRNNVFFSLLKKEFEFNDDDE